jgi:hypothetical protein
MDFVIYVSLMILSTNKRVLELRYGKKLVAPLYCSYLKRGHYGSIVIKRPRLILSQLNPAHSLMSHTF